MAVLPPVAVAPLAVEEEALEGVFEGGLEEAVFEEDLPTIFTLSETNPLFAVEEKISKWNGERLSLRLSPTRKEYGAVGSEPSPGGGNVSFVWQRSGVWRWMLTYPRTRYSFEGDSHRDGNWRIECTALGLSSR